MSVSEKVCLEFQKFTPEDNDRHLFSTVADKIHLLAPSDSDLKLVIEKQNKKYKGYCRIASAVGLFFAEDSASDPETVLAKVEKKIAQQLSLWKRRRFLSPQSAAG